MAGKNMIISTGIKDLDKILDGLYIGDNVVWHDDAGSLAHAFCMSFLRTSERQKRPLIYVSFDRSPRNLLDKLGSLSKREDLIILDCFTYGKGEGADVFLSFYEYNEEDMPCRILPVEEPEKVEGVTDAFYGVHSTLEGDVRFIFESLTGMQELWGDEEDLISFYSAACPRLYELDTVAYWILEKGAHSQRLKARINQIAQVAVDLSVKRGKTSLTVIKAEKRDQEALNKPYFYWSKGVRVHFETEKRVTGRIDLGGRLKELRLKRGLSQTELARLVGVTPSTISQIESDLIYPSLPALLKMADVLTVEMSSFFNETDAVARRIVFPASEAAAVKIPDLPSGSIKASLLTSLDFEPKAEPYVVEIPPKKTLPSHFFVHKGEEMGYLLEGELQLKMKKTTHTVHAGDVVYLTTEMPTQWKNPGPRPARLLWVRVT